jgi:hypothetical protein
MHPARELDEVFKARQDFRPLVFAPGARLLVGWLGGSLLASWLRILLFDCRHSNYSFAKSARLRVLLIHPSKKCRHEVGCACH